MLRWRVNIGASVAAAFIPSELNAAVALVTNVTGFRTVGGCVAVVSPMNLQCELAA
jgi:hypothetical protein